MKASEFVAQQLLQSDAPYSLKYRKQPKAPVSVRLPVGLIAWVTVLHSRGLGASKSEVIQLLLDVAVEQVASMDVLGPDLYDAAEALTEHLTEQIREAR